ncbi:MAG TPA: GldG family protein [Kiritimatiellia bacterium]|jgi:hypothetical protein|nr:GldG family protein [Kiritimatiellia bacterium]HPK69741.1 GldG family protein [Kiritimatiellia bacterium]HQM22679.1 GldG family protein [Kiritimatiellia bacterium]
MSLLPSSPLAASRLQRIVLRANVALAVLLSVAIFAMVNYLAQRHYARWHWRAAHSVRLADASRRLLEATANEIRLHVLVRPGHEAYGPLALLLQEYAAASGNVNVEFVDPDLAGARTKELARQFNLSGEECVVLATGGRHLAIPAADLVEYVLPANTTENPRRLFRGEALISGAIHALTQATRPVVCFLEGHGEHAPVDFDRLRGYSRLAALLRDQNLDLEQLDLGQTKMVPARCALLVVAGPQRELAPFEVALLRDYLTRKGRLLLLLDARVSTGLEALLHDWGIALGDDVVVDEAHTLSGRELYVASYPPHAITAPLQDLASVFVLPRSVRARTPEAGGDQPIVTPLALCSSAGWAEFNLDDAAVHFDPQVDIPGPVPVAVAVERGPVAGVHVQIRPTRLVVFGDSDFVSNGGLTGANADFFLGAVNWLLDRDIAMAITAPALPELQLVMNARQLRQLFWLAVVALPGAVMLVGLFAIWRRRR